MSSPEPLPAGERIDGDPLGRVPVDRLPLLEEYVTLLLRWNERVNLVARSSGREEVLGHIRHSLTLLTRAFPAGALIVDWGTGGGLPAVPLAVALPDVRIVAVDSIAKKTAALKMMVAELSLANLEVWHGRAEQWSGEASHFVSRATAPLRDLWKWSRPRLAQPCYVRGADGETVWSPGLLALKGGDPINGDLAQEIRQVRQGRVFSYALAQVAPGLGLEQKYILHVTKSTGDDPDGHGQ